MSITIDLNDALVQQAEQYARQHGQSQVVQQPAQIGAVEDMIGSRLMVKQDNAG